MQRIYSRKDKTAGDIYDNPAVCQRSDTGNSAGCLGVYLCEVVSVKYGGKVLKDMNVGS